LNSNSKPNLKSNNGEEMKKRKKKRRRPRRLGLLGLRQPAQPTGPALYISSPLAHARAVAGRPQLTRNSPARRPHALLPSPAAAAT